jgi:hypothetical protein
LLDLSGNFRAGARNQLAKLGKRLLDVEGSGRDTGSGVRQSKRLKDAGRIVILVVGRHGRPRA